MQYLATQNFRSQNSDNFVISLSLKPNMIICGGDLKEVRYLNETFKPQFAETYIVYKKYFMVIVSLFNVITYIYYKWVNSQEIT